MRKRIQSIALLLMSFAAGIVAQLIAFRLTGDMVDSTTRLVEITLGCVVAVLVCFGIVTAFDFASRSDQFELITKRMDTLSTQFGLSVEFVPDQSGEEDGLTYERMTKLVRGVQKSLVFVDFWAETATHRDGAKKSHLRRQAYYEEIYRQIEIRSRQSQDGAAFHRRIIQFPDASTSLEVAKLSGDASFIEYVGRCLELQEEHPGISAVKMSDPYVHLHFAIFDGRYVVLPILTADPKAKGLRRNGALIFDDHVGELVAKLMNVYELLDSVAHPITKENIEKPGAVEVT